MKKALIFIFVLMVSASISHAQKAKKGEWHVLLMASTHDQKVGTAVSKSLEDAKDNLTVLADILQLELTINEISGNDFTAPNVVAGVQKLLDTPRPKKGKFMGTVMTFNHGVNFENTWTRLPFMLCNPKENVMRSKSQLVSVEEIYNALKDKSKFDHVHVWAELCDNIPNGFVNAPSKGALQLHTLKGGTPEGNLEDLLYGVKSELMVSSSYGQASFTHDMIGGAFSNSVFKAFEDVMNGQTEAKFEGVGGVFESVQANTQIFAVKIGGSNSIIQTPQCFVDGIPNSIPPVNTNFNQPEEIITNNFGNNNGNNGNSNKTCKQVSNQINGDDVPHISLKHSTPLDKITGTYTKTSVKKAEKKKSTKSKDKKKSKSGASW
ncbi:MAG: hypothetical protein ACPGJS_10225 [Flammeovirgaceae bacterium]